MLFSAQPGLISNGVSGLRNFAVVAQSMADEIRASGEVAIATPGDPYAAFGDRAGAIAEWLSSVAAQASTTAERLAENQRTGDIAQTAGWEQGGHVQNVANNVTSGPDEDGTVSLGALSVEPAKAKAAKVMNEHIEIWGQQNLAFIPGPVPPIPDGGGGSNSDGLTWGDGSSSGTPSTPRPAGDATTADSPEQQPDRIVDPRFTVGREAGDFAGWFQDPRTGFFIDPSTGREYDPVSGRWIDPVTGRPFGEVTQYSSRLEGLNGGTTGGLLGGGNSGLGTSQTTAFTSAYGGMPPPSLPPQNPAAGQLSEAARANLAAKAFVAQNMLARDGVHPYLPPIQAGCPEDRPTRTSRAVPVEDDIWSHTGPVSPGVLGDE